MNAIESRAPCGVNKSDDKLWLVDFTKVRFPFRSSNGVNDHLSMYYLFVFEAEQYVMG